MKRPSGFDREPEPRAHQAPEDGDWSAPGDFEEDVAARPDLSEERAARGALGVRWPFRRRAQSETSDDTLVPGEADTPAEPDTAATMDLSGLESDLAAIEALRAENAEQEDPGTNAFRPALRVVGDTRLSAVDAGAETAVLVPISAPTEDAQSGLRVAEQQLKEAIRGRKRRERREKRRFTWHLRQRRRPWLIGGAAVLAVAVFVVVGVFTPLMSVRVVQVDGATRVDVASVEAALAPLMGTPLALVDQAEVHRALVPFPLIQRYSVETIPPHTLVVRLEERVPVVAIPTAAGFDLVDPAGVTVEQTEARPDGFPVAEGIAATRSSAAFAEAARVLRDVPAELRAQLESATASTGQDVSFVLRNGVEVVWGDAEESPRKAVVLTAMLAALGEQPVTLIDVSSSEAPIFR